MLLSFSDIVIPKQSASHHESKAHQQLRQAYLHEREQLLACEIELNRSKVIVIDEQGRIIRLSLMLEH
ncbi:MULTISPECIES: hypothetical protein [Vibrio]|uniref:hypothetical protein n=1 Tax=Vibrio TaxID=662 RepID=UPI0009347A6E|nr:MULTISPECIES: hypothetical protein [Vibrio]